MPDRGFTLVEVLVGLAVVVLALGAALRAASEVVASEDAVEARIAARWVATDHFDELRARSAFPNPGISQGETEQIGLRFYWRETVDPTPQARFRRVKVEVAQTADGPALAVIQGVLYGGLGS